MNDSILDLVLDEWREKSKLSLYQRDPEAWVSDVLGMHWWEKQREIAADYVSTTRVAVKSANGTGKSHQVADLICHHVSVWPIDEALAIISAPSVPQIERVIFAYLKNRYNYSLNAGNPLRGQINESLEWKYNTPAGNQFLAFGKKPADQDIVSTFQGTRKKRTRVFLDEAGGVPEELFTAAEAVTTGSESGIMAIGNPDKRGTSFHSMFTNPDLAQDWALHTISAFDLPTFTGEIVYPDDPQKQHALLTSGMTTPEWVEHKRRAWGEGSARWQAKVLGEFPGEDDNAFFPQYALDKAYNTQIDSEADVIMGCDIALKGSDETVIYTNRGGKVRFHKAMSKGDTLDNARMIHEEAIRAGAKQVRVDSAGTGQGVFDVLDGLDEFRSKPYVLIGLNGAKGTPDNTRWAQARSWYYDNLLDMMNSGELDLDYEDKELREELISQTADFNIRGALQITPKREMRNKGLASPDHLDAVVYATAPIDRAFSAPKQFDATPEQYGDSRGDFGGFRRISILN